MRVLDYRVRNKKGRDMKNICVGLLGLGTVGAGVVKVIDENKSLIEKRLGCPLILKKVCDLDITTDRGVFLDKGILTTRVEDLLNDPEISIIIELIGGIEPAKSIILSAMEKGKHVVTANKALLAHHGAELMESAFRNQVDISFEGSVGGGIPIIRSIKEGLAANRINSILGILNGTANYILTKMTDEGGKFQDILKEAQDRGFAEADPSLDIEGIDTAHKLAILVSLSYGIKVNFASIYTEGISRITPLDIEYTKELGYRIKLLAISKGTDSEIEARVHPTLIPAAHLLSKVDGTFNAIFLTGDAVGSTLFYGRGAGRMPTASAVVGDIIEIARSILKGITQRVPTFSFQRESLQEMKVKDINDISTRYYLRFSAQDQPGVLSKISGILGKYGISISSVIQKGRQIMGAVPIFMLTHEAKEVNVRKALKEIDALPVTAGEPVIIRIENQFNPGE
jgi:homoserine dehydrogenase